MVKRFTLHGANPRVLFWLVWLVFWGTGSLVIVGYLHRDNNYGVRPGDFELRTIDSTEFAKLKPEQQTSWNRVRNSDAYVKIIIKSPFVFSHVRTQVVPLLVFAMITLVSYVRWHRLPVPKPENADDT